MTVNPDIRYGREFGQATVLGNLIDGFFQKPMEEQTKAMAWSHACPVVDEVIKTYGEKWAQTHPNASTDEILREGARLARNRYAECNFVFGLVMEKAKELNEPLYEQLIQSVARREDEPDGPHKLDFVPKSHKEIMAPMTTPIGYALPRVVIEQMGRGEDNVERTPERLVKAMDMIETAVKVSRTPIELTIRLSEEAAKMDADPKTVLYHLLSSEIMHEENCVTMFKDMVAEMRRLAPTLAAVYGKMSPTEKEELGLVDF